MMRHFGILVLPIFGLVVCLPAQGQAKPRQFEDFGISTIFKGEPSIPVLATPEQRRFRTTITRGATKGWGVEDGITGEEFKVPGPNLAGHYAIVIWGCGSPCLTMAIVDLETGRVFPPPFHQGPGHSYVQLPWAFTAEPSLSYRADGRPLIANICESEGSVSLDGNAGWQEQGCGPHYFVMGDKGPEMVYRIFKK